MQRPLAFVLLAGLVVGCGSGGSGTLLAPQPQWSRSRADSRNSGAGFDLTNNAGNLKWRTDLGGPLGTTPAVGVHGIVYATVESTAGAPEGRLVAVNPDGSVRWSFPSSGAPAIAPVDSSPAVDTNDNVYFGTEDGRVFAVDSSGAQIWCFDTGRSGACQGATGQGGAAVRFSPLLDVDVVENRTSAVFFGSADGHFFAIGGAAGELRWSYLAGGGLAGPAAIDQNGVVYSAFSDVGLIGFSRQGSIGVFRFPHGTATVSPAAAPAVGVDVLFQVLTAADGLGQVVAINPDESEAWGARFDMESPPAGPPAFQTRNIVAQLVEELAVVDSAGALYVLNQKTGQAAGMCLGGESAGEPCTVDADCPSGSCDPRLFEAGAPVSGSPSTGVDGSIVFATAPPAGTPATLFAVQRRLCLGGDAIGQPCRSDAECPGDPSSTCFPAADADGLVKVRWSLSRFCSGGDAGLGPCDTDADCGPGGSCTALGAIHGSPAMAADGTVYIGSDDGFLYAIGGG